jgi:hypothetical protein
MTHANEKLTQIQLELLHSFRYITDEQQLKEVKSLLNFYFRKRLDAAVDKAEKERNYTESIYKDWLAKDSK